MRINFLGHLSIDYNVVLGVENKFFGGGVYHGAITAKRLGSDSQVITMCAPGDKNNFEIFTDLGVGITYLDSPTSTSIRNEYPTQNPDDRISRVISQGRAFKAEDLNKISAADIWHINPLWAGEFPPELLKIARAKAPLLAGDAQGFLRQVGPDGQMFHQDWADKRNYLKLFDYFKVDIREAEVLTGLKEPKKASQVLHELGVKVVVLTHQAGVCVFNGNDFFESQFSPYRIEGRTGRGDTCMAAFLVAQNNSELKQAAKLAAEVTSKKMQYAGAYRG